MSDQYPASFEQRIQRTQRESADSAAQSSRQYADWKDYAESVLQAARIIGPKLAAIRDPTTILFIDNEPLPAVADHKPRRKQPVEPVAPAVEVARGWNLADRTYGRELTDIYVPHDEGGGSSYISKQGAYALLLNPEGQLIPCWTKLKPHEGVSVTGAVRIAGSYPDWPTTTYGHRGLPVMYWSKPYSYFRSKEYTEQQEDTGIDFKQGIGNQFVERDNAKYSGIYLQQIEAKLVKLVLRHGF